MTGPGPVRRGAAHPRAKLTRDDVVTMRVRYQQGGVSQVALAKQYRISPQHVSRVVRRAQWDDSG
jgi:Mor family transcriptional regulator